MLSLIRSLRCPVVLVMALAMCALLGSGGFALAAEIQVAGSAREPGLMADAVREGILAGCAV